jgi:hypothetical protein
MPSDLVLSQPPPGLMARLQHPDGECIELPIVAIAALRQSDGSWEFDIIAASPDRAFGALMTGSALSSYGSVGIEARPPALAPT